LSFASVYHDVVMRTTVTIDDDVYQSAQHLARVTRRRLGVVLSELARRGLKASDAGPSVREGKRFPCFDVPDDAPVIPASLIEEVLDEESIF